MKNETRLAFTGYLQQIAQLNHVSVEAVTSKFNAIPSVQQTMENKIQESSEFLKSINVVPVDEKEGEKIGLGVSGTIASTTDTETQERATRDVHAADASKYRCEQTNYDTHMRYALLDMWAKFPDFQIRLTNQIIQRIALDRIMIGFNGVTRAETSNRATNSLLQDVNIGWLQQIRANAPERWMKESESGSGKVVVGANSSAYKNLDALVYDAVNNLIDPWFQDDTKLLVLTGRKLLSDKYFPLLNDENKPTEKLAADLIISQKRLGGLQAARVPSFPPNALLITRFDNLSVYFQSGAQRRSVIDNPKRDRIETYQSSNDAFVVEDYGCAALVENIEIAQ
jgi:P2 family phage major capsid protein